MTGILVSLLIGALAGWLAGKIMKKGMGLLVCIYEFTSYILILFSIYHNADSRKIIIVPRNKRTITYNLEWQVI